MDDILLHMSIRNRLTLRPIHWISAMLGCNLGRPVKTKDPRKCITLIISLLTLISLAAQVYFVWVNRHKSVLFYSDAICTCFQGIASLTKLIHLTLLHSQLFKLLQSVQNATVLRGLELFKLELPKKHAMIEEIQEMLQQSWKNIKRQLHFFFVAVFGIACWYFCFCLFINVYRIYKNPHEHDLIYLFPAQFPKWYKNDTHIPHFLMEYTIVGAEWYLCSVVGTLFASLFLVLCSHGIDLLAILCKLISYANNDEYVPREERLKYITCCIKLQQHVYKYCSDLNEAYKIQTVIFVIITMFIKCLIVFQASLAGVGNMYVIFQGFLYFSATTFEVSIFCFKGQRLTTESCHLPTVVYNSKWYSESAHYKFLTQMMIMRSNRKIELTVGGFATLSLVTFVAIMRTSVSYFLLLREVNEKN